MMGKDVDEKLALSEIERSDVSESLKKSMSFVLKRSLPIPKYVSPERLEELEFPEDLTQLTLSQLGQVMTTWTAVLAFMQYEVAKADIEQTAKKNQMDFEKKKFYLELVQNRDLTEEERKAKLVAEDRMARLQAKFEYARARFTLLKALMGSYQKYYTALSRELSRRGVGEAYPEEPQDDDMPEIKASPSLFKSMREEENEHDDGGDAGYGG